MIFFKASSDEEGAALHMICVEMTSQSVKKLRPCYLFNSHGDRTPKSQRHAQALALTP